MRKLILIGISILFTTAAFSQKEFKSRNYDFKLKYPADWILMDNKDSELP